MSRSATQTEWLDPSVVDESYPDARDLSLSLYSEDAPLPPYEPSPLARYEAAQLARSQRMVQPEQLAQRLVHCERWLGTHGLDG